MPKSTKKKKDKAADFSKAKLKLGKGKKLANNAIDTSYKARSIALPEQSITHEKSSDAPATKRRLTFDDLISQLKHYNASTRKDAIDGLRELISEYATLGLQNLTIIITRCVRVIGDEDASVRKALLAFFDWFIPSIPKHDLQPHAPALLLFTTSALTHIFPEIRIDAVKFLDILLEHMPEIVVEGWSTESSSHGRRVLEGYLGLLSAGTAFGGDGDPMKATSTASVVLSPKSKLVVLASLSTFLREAMAIRDGVPSTSSQTLTPSVPKWFLASSFTSQSALETLTTLMSPRSDNGPPVMQCLEDESPAYSGDFAGAFDLAGTSVANAWTLGQLSDLGSTDLLALESSSLNGQESYLAQLATALQPTLLASFLDSAPAAFPPAGTPPETELQTVLAVAKIARSLYVTPSRGTSKHDAQSKQLDKLSIVLGHMASYFPFSDNRAGGGKRDVKIEGIYETLNLIFCEMTSLLVLAAPPTAPQGPRRRGVSASTAKPAGSTTQSYSHVTPPQLERVQAYVTQALRGELPHGTSTQTALPHPISHTSYCALLPTVWALISIADQGEGPNQVLLSLLSHALKASSSSAVKRHTIEFVGLLALLCTDPQYRGPFALGRRPEEDQKFQEWLLHLPKILWELGANNLPAAEMILRLLLRLSQRKSSLLDLSTAAALRARLVPYFTITHATRGKLPGPFTKLPHPPLSCTRRMALDVAATLVFRATSGDAGELTEAVSQAVDGTDDALYWQMIARR